MDPVLVATAATASAGFGVALAYLAMQRVVYLMAVTVRRNRRQ